MHLGAAAAVVLHPINGQESRCGRADRASSAVAFTSPLYWCRIGRGIALEHAAARAAVEEHEGERAAVDGNLRERQAAQPLRLLRVRRHQGAALAHDVHLEFDLAHRGGNRAFPMAGRIGG
jgi:hypothetical protein